MLGSIKAKFLSCDASFRQWKCQDATVIFKIYDAIGEGVTQYARSNKMDALCPFRYNQICFLIGIL